ncbi:MAG: MurR/RpiR family transcriptional regulator [Lysobacterales bacterium]
MEPNPSPLLRIRAERDQMSAIERRIADYIVENAQLLRDYSSQQLANALGISQSSVVKFSQKIGFKGYPDLKFSIGEAIARGDGNGGSGTAEGGAATAASAVEKHASASENLWNIKARAEEETRLINLPETIEGVARAIGQARHLFVVGLGSDGAPARGFAQRLALIGMLPIFHFDPVLATTSVAAAGNGDALLVFSEHGRQTSLCHLARQMRESGGKVVSLTRHTANPLRAHADAALLVSAHDDRAHVEPLLYQSALQHLLDLIFVYLCEHGKARLDQLDANLDRIRAMQDL